VSWKDRKEFMADLKGVYQAVTRKEAEKALVGLREKWGTR